MPSKTYAAPQPFTDETRPPIELHPVESSQVKAIGYDAESRTLAVAFKHGNGAIYHYPNVDAETHEAFVKAESIGAFFGNNLKLLPFKKYRAEAVKAEA